VLTLLLAALLLLAGPLTGSLAAAAGASDATRGDRTAQAGRHADDDAASVGSTRLSSSRIRTAAPRTQLDSAAADLPRVTEPVDGRHEPVIPSAQDTAAGAAPPRSTHSRAPPA
jgi:hypothetical protein